MTVSLALVVGALTAHGVDDEQVWSDFASWVQSCSGAPRLEDYAQHLEGSGLGEDEVDRRLEVIRTLFREDPVRGVEVSFDVVFSRPVTGDAEQDGFTSTPNVFMMESAEDLTPGAVVDVGAGQGRNAVWLAEQGWQVTAIDISGVGLAAAQRNASAAGTSIETVKTTYDAFDFGVERWDMVLMILSWAPVSDPAFVSRIEASLRPGGVLVFEHVIDKPEEPFPAAVHALVPNQLRGCFGGLVTEYYDESERLGDWGGPPTPIVRMVARKPVDSERTAGEAGGASIEAQDSRPDGQDVARRRDAR
jgi:2-polyprenyl-3-methyl-5-hydroxy-6-metoxy-1,4-benzoquinol methylase